LERVKLVGAQPVYALGNGSVTQHIRTDRSGSRIANPPPRNTQQADQAKAPSNTTTPRNDRIAQVAQALADFTPAHTVPVPASPDQSSPGTPPGAINLVSPSPPPPPRRGTRVRRQTNRYSHNNW